MPTLRLNDRRLCLVLLTALGASTPSQSIASTDPSMQHFSVIASAESIHDNAVSLNQALAINVSGNPLAPTSSSPVFAFQLDTDIDDGANTGRAYAMLGRTGLSLFTYGDVELDTGYGSGIVVATFAVDDAPRWARVYTSMKFRGPILFDPLTNATFGSLNAVATIERLSDNSIIHGFSQSTVIPTIESFPNTSTNEWEYCFVSYYLLSPATSYAATVSANSLFTSWDPLDFAISAEVDMSLVLLNDPPHPPFARGDFNFDGEITDADIPGFVAALEGFASFQSFFSTLDPVIDLFGCPLVPTMDLADYLGDVNGDGGLDGSDVDAFVALLLGGAGRPSTPIPEPDVFAVFLSGSLFLSTRRRTRCRRCV